MEKKLWTVVLVLAISSAAFGAQDIAGGYIKPLGGDVITIDKDQSDWYAIAGLDWLEFGGSASAASTTRTIGKWTIIGWTFGAHAGISCMTSRIQRSQRENQDKRERPGARIV